MSQRASFPFLRDRAAARKAVLIQGRTGWQVPMHDEALVYQWLYDWLVEPTLGDPQPRCAAGLDLLVPAFLRLCQHARGEGGNPV